MTVGTGPFGGSPDGVFNFAFHAPAHVLYYKGTTSRYYSVDVDGEWLEDVAWVDDKVPRRGARHRGAHRLLQRQGRARGRR